MTLYYKVVNTSVKLYIKNGSTLKHLYNIKGEIGDSILILIEDYFEKNNIILEFDQLESLV